MTEEGAKEMLVEEQLSKERWRRVGMSGSLSRRRSEEMAQSNTFSPPAPEVPFESQRGWWQLKSHRMKEISGGGRKGVGSTIPRRRANR